MLVVSRKPDQSVVFPNLGISVQVLRVAGKTVRIGIAAPEDVRVLRGELTTGDEFRDAAISASKQRHELRNRLNSASLALHILQKQLDAGAIVDAETTLERALAELAELDRVASGGSAEDSPTPPQTPRRALVVEDNANERELLAGYLRLCGYEVDTVEDGLAAMVHLASRTRPDIVLLDMQMPRMDGCKTVSAIRGNPNYRGIKLFAISGMDRSKLKMPEGERGVDRWFSKPLRPAEFESQLRAAIDSSCVVA